MYACKQGVFGVGDRNFIPLLVRNLYSGLHTFLASHICPPSTCHSHWIWIKQKNKQLPWEMRRMPHSITMQGGAWRCSPHVPRRVASLSFNRSPATALLLLILYLYLAIHFSRSIEQEGDDGLRWVWLLLFSVFQFQRLFPAFCLLFSGSTTDLTPWPGHVSPAPTYIASLPTTPTISPSTLAARADSRGPGTGRPMRLSNIHGLAQTRLHPA